MIFPQKSGNPLSAYKTVYNLENIIHNLIFMDLFRHTFADEVVRGGWARGEMKTSV